jgi:hypothetical protein
MSELPPRPSLAHLRKQAKALLSRLRAQNPNATLAAAAAPPLFPRLTPKARESLRSGLFAGLPQPLDAARHEVAVRSAAPIPTSVLIPNGERTMRVFQGAATEADRLHHTEIALVHLLLGVLRERHSIATLREEQT